jgi:hypothetical protein
LDPTTYKLLSINLYFVDYVIQNSYCVKLYEIITTTEHVRIRKEDEVVSSEGLEEINWESKNIILRPFA